MRQDLEDKVKQWFTDRNLQTANPVKQFTKLMEEGGELYEGLAKGKKNLISDAIGDMQVVLIGLKLQIENGNQIEASQAELDLLALTSHLGYMAEEIFKHIYQSKNEKIYLTPNMMAINGYLNAIAIHHGMSANDCLEMAYEEIKDRKGKMIDGVFVKEADL